MDPVFDPQTTPVLELATLDQLLALDDGSIGLMQEMLALYQEDMPGRLQALEISVHEGNHTEVAELAHAIKGAASTIGAPRPRAIAAAMEAMGRRGNEPLPSLALLAADLKRHYLESVDALTSFITARQS